jgi:hypothetical protein
MWRILPTKRRTGYFVWAVALMALVVPEILASVGARGALVPSFDSTLHAITRHHSWVGAAGLFGLAVVQSARSDDFLRRTPGGRLTSGWVVNRPSQQFDDEGVSPMFLIFLAAAPVFVELTIWAASHSWGGSTAQVREERSGGILYALIFLLWFVVPGGVALMFGRDVPFPTLSRTSANVADWLAARRSRLAPLLAWFFYHVVYVAPAFLVVEAFHG